MLNWNGWDDTISCLESLLRLDYDNFRIVVCDNGSTDDSVKRIRDWAAAQSLGPNVTSRCGQVAADPGEECARRPEIAFLNEQLFLLQNEANLGFAGGNNAGLKFALARGDMDYAWLLNNDTVVDPASLTHLVEKLRSTQGVGLCGSTLLYHYDPQTVQARGARYNKWLARVRHVGAHQSASEPVNEDAYARNMDYVVGASMLVSRDFVDEVGLIGEDYFLYFEELDWIRRAGGRFGFAYASRSIVYHKEGAATGATTGKKSRTGEYYGTRARILFTRKFHPYALATVLMAIMASLLVRMLKGQFAIAGATWRAALDGLRGRTGATSGF